MIEWRVCWTASSNISFRGKSEWGVWDGDEDATADEIEVELSEGDGGELAPALQQAVDLSGFEWWVETREVDDDREDRHGDR
jgi:hypothetical protein